MNIGGLMLMNTRAILISLLLLSSNALAIDAVPTPIYPSPILQMGDGKYWLLFTPLTYKVLDTGKTISVPKGFVTDLASIPRPMWSILPPNGNYMFAAIVHDYLYWMGQVLCSRDQADAVLSLAMKESGVGDITRQTIYLGVRKGGQSSWDDNAKARTKREIRFLSTSYVDRIPQLPVDAKRTLESIQADAKLKGSGDSIGFSNSMSEIREACGAALDAVRRGL